MASTLFDGQFIYSYPLGQPPAREGEHERIDGPRHAASCEGKALFSLGVSVPKTDLHIVGTQQIE